ncbi:MAG: IS21-like element helper ATPase IstB [Gemmatimonadota bacterium]|nr:IS21-like element helper ATPase IstB [Gemmatimonadota bacterium]
MSAAVSYERVRDQLDRLKMEAALTALDEILERGQKKDKLTVEVLDELLTHELDARFERRVATNLKLSGLPASKTLEDFDYEAQPQVPKDVLDELATLRFLHQGENVLLLGPCGVGKTHLSIGLALKAIEQGHRVYFLTLHDLVTRFRAHREKNRLDVLLRVLTRPKVLVLDELGFVPLEQPDATFLFEVVNKRYQAHKSIIVTSNKSFGQWDEIFPDPVLATALLDRLLHHATTINIRGESYRLRHRRNAGLAVPTP